jgi:hypothetical protein
MDSDTSKAADTNSVTLQPDYIEVVWRGAQTADKVRVSNNQVLAAAQQFQTQHKPLVLYLQILNHPEMPNMEAFYEVLKVFQAVTFDRLAVCGKLPATMMPLIKTVIKSYNRQMELELFEESDKALAWLKSDARGNRDF